MPLQKQHHGVLMSIVDDLNEAWSDRRQRLGGLAPVDESINGM
jgi:hypothetical protein